VNALDELRDAIDAHVGAASGDRKHTWMDAMRILDAFEDAHPGLEDHTIPCHVCKKPTIEAGAFAEGRKGKWIWQVCCSNACAKGAK